MALSFNAACLASGNSQSKNLGLTSHSQNQGDEPTSLLGCSGEGSNFFVSENSSGSNSTEVAGIISFSNYESSNSSGSAETIGLVGEASSSGDSSCSSSDGGSSGGSFSMDC